MANSTEVTSKKVAGANGTVLVVEDETVLRLAVSKMLRKEGFTVPEAGDGSAAVELFRFHQKDIDVLLLDMTIPGTPSRTVVAEVSRICPDVKILFTSAYSREVADPMADTRQIRAFLRKPFRLHDLLALVRETISAAR